MRILLVEDNAANLRLARDVLRKAGHDVSEARDGDAALRLARAELPDLVVMDVQLPGRDGLSVTQELRADPRTAAVPILALTALAMVGDRERILAAGCDGYLAKPFRYRTLIAEVERLGARPESR